MKNLITIAALFIISTAAHSQWVAQVSGNAAELRGVYFTNPQIGYVVGSDGTMVKTIDGGTNWLPLSPGTVDTLPSGSASRKTSMDQSLGNADHAPKMGL